MKSFKNVFSILDKMVRQTVSGSFKLTDYLPGFLYSMSFCRWLVYLPCLGYLL